MFKVELREKSLNNGLFLKVKVRFVIINGKLLNVLVRFVIRNIVYSDSQDVYVEYFLYLLNVG